MELAVKEEKDGKKDEGGESKKRGEEQSMVEREGEGREKEERKVRGEA